jgi:hypothetical protein
VQERPIKVEGPLEVQFIDLNQAEVDSKEAEAVARLVESLADIPSAVVRVGSISMIKFSTPDGAVVQTRTLSQIEIRAMERFPETQINPRIALEALSNAVLTLQATEEPGVAAPSPPSNRPMHTVSGPEDVPILRA